MAGTASIMGVVWDHPILAGLKIYEVKLTELNDSGIEGKAILVLNQATQTLVVHLMAEGLEPNQPGQFHPQHIHGFADDHNATVPPTGFDPDGDGFLEVGEGAAFYGPVQLNLSLTPDISVHDVVGTEHNHAGQEQFPSIGPSGRENYLETFVFRADDPNAQTNFELIQPLDAKVMVIHGLSVSVGPGLGTPGEVDGTAGYKAGLPVAAGEIREITRLDRIFDALEDLVGHGDRHGGRDDDHHAHHHHGDWHM